MVKERNIGIDLLRIISMILVLMLHVLGQGGILNNCLLLSPNYQLVWLLEIIAYCAVNVYALISGYVGVDSKFKYSNIVNLWLKVVFYTICITVFCIIFIPGNLSFRNIIKAFFPVLFNEYWYFTSYFCMFFFIPYFNFLLNKLSKKNVRKLIILLILLFSLFAMISPTDIFNLSSGYCVLWLSVLYLIGGYIKKYAMFKSCSSRKLLFGFLFCVIFTWSTKLIIEVITLGIFGYIRGNLFLIRYNSITILFQSIFLLILFSRVKLIKTKKLIQYLAPLSFSVYLIHVHPLIWNNFMKNAFVSYCDYSLPMLFLAILLSVVAIYIVCTIIDIARDKLFKKLRVKQFSNWFVEKMAKLINKKLKI